MTYICELCPRACKSLRTENENIGGVCGMPYKLKVARAAPHFGEEPPISGTNGSGTVFFSGCQLKCCYCQNYCVSHEKYGKEISVNRLAEIFKELENKGVHNINLVSATQFVPLIIEALEIYRPKIPIVYNSGGYETEKTLRMLKDYVDIFLLDFKYFSNERAKKYSKAENYPQNAKKALKAAYEITGPKVIDRSGIMKSGVIVRHLLMPLGTKDAIAIIDYIKEQKMDIIFSLMCQYTVMPQVKFPEILRKVTEREYNKVLSYMLNSGIDGYVQESNSATKKYIPAFDLSGV